MIPHSRKDAQVQLNSQKLKLSSYLQTLPKRGKEGGRGGRGQKQEGRTEAKKELERLLKILFI